MSNIYIKAGVVVGTGIEDAIKEAKQKAEALDVCFTFDFNGVEIFVSKNTDVEKEIAEYKKNKKYEDDLRMRKVLLNLWR